MPILDSTNQLRKDSVNALGIETTEINSENSVRHNFDSRINRLTSFFFFLMKHTSIFEIFSLLFGKCK